MSFPAYLLAISSILLILIYLYFKYNFRKCPEGKAMIILGYLGKNRQYKAIFSGSAFLIPLIQYVEFIDLTVFRKELKLKTKGEDGKIFTSDIKVNYSITNNSIDIKNAINMLSGLPLEKIELIGGNIIELCAQELALKNEIVKFEHLKFENNLSRKVNEEFEKYGFHIADINITFY